MLGVLLMLQVAGSDLPQPPPFVPPKTQTARCVGVDSLDRRQTLTLESRWLPDEHRAAVFVRDDSSGLLKDGEWLENQNGIYRDGDRKQGIVLDWDDTSFSKRVGDQYARIAIQHANIASASILYVSRAYSDREQTAMRYFMKARSFSQAIAACLSRGSGGTSTMRLDRARCPDRGLTRGQLGTAGAHVRRNLRG